MGILLWTTQINDCSANWLIAWGTARVSVKAVLETDSLSLIHIYPHDGVLRPKDPLKHVDKGDDEHKVQGRVGEIRPDVLK